LRRLAASQRPLSKGGGEKTVMHGGNVAMLYTIGNYKAPGGLANFNKFNLINTNPGKFDVETSIMSPQICLFQTLIRKSLKITKNLVFSRF
jgi:hypothetical protein